MIGEGGDQSLSVRTITGEHVGDVPCDGVLGLTWGRELTEVSRCEFTLNTANEPIVEDLRPWLHWVTVWENGTPLWTGPIQLVRITRKQTVVTCRDVSTYMWRTRTPITKQWAGLDTGIIASELWKLMLDLHRIKVTPVVLPNLGDRFSIGVTADSQMLNQEMDKLVKLGLEWTVVAGTPVFGLQPTTQVGDTLQECDFLEELERQRDGTDTFNDVRLQGKNFAATAVADLKGLRLQKLVSLDDVSGVANIQKAVRQYAQSTARIKDSLVVPAGASLDPQCQLTLGDLVPGAHFGVWAQNVGAMMRLTSMQVVTGAGSYDVQVTLETVQEQVELSDFLGGS